VIIISIESKFFSKLIETGDYATVDDRQIRQKFFSGQFKRMFKFVQNFKTKYSKVPDMETFSSKFPEFEVSATPETMEFYCDEVRTKVKHNQIVDGIEKIGEELEDMNTDGAYDIIKTLVRTVESDIVLGDTKKINEDVEDRWKKYLERRNTGGIIGIPTTLEAFDRMTGGLGKTDLITILGFTGVGKTWALIILGVLLARSGTKVLFITREMNTDQVMKRTDAVWCGISYTDFNRGQLSQKDEVKYREYLNSIQQVEDNFVVELSTGGVTNIAAMIDKHSPEVVLVDGAYLMADDEEDDDWKGIMKVWRGMKQLALIKKVPFITTSQSKEGDNVSLGKISFSKALANECDIVIALQQDKEMFAMKDIMWKPLKLRDSEMTGYFVTKWDWNRMDYHTTIYEGRFLDKPTAEEIPDTVQDIDDGKMTKR